MRNLISTLAIISLLLPISAFSTERIKRLGVGFSNQMKNDITAVSFKLQRSKFIALGGVIALDTNDDNGGSGAGLKVYRNIFDEPNLNFYMAIMGAMISNTTDGKKEKGFQFDFTCGSEFNFAGLTSLGFSVEFGVSLDELDDLTLRTVGSNFLVTAVHFYL